MEQKRMDEFYKDSPPIGYYRPNEEFQRRMVDQDESVSLALRDILEELKTLNDTLKTILEVKEWGAK